MSGVPAIHRRIPLVTGRTGDSGSERWVETTARDPGHVPNSWDCPWGTSCSVQKKRRVALAAAAVVGDPAPGRPRLPWRQC